MATLRDRFENYQHHWQNEFSMDADMVNVVLNFANHPAFYKGYVRAKSEIEAKRFILEVMKRGMVVISSVLTPEQITMVANVDIQSFFESLVCLDSRFTAIDNSHPHLDQKEACIVYGIVVGMGELCYPVDIEYRADFIEGLVEALEVSESVANYIEELRSLRSPMAAITH